VLVIDDSEKALTMSDDRLEEAIIRTGAKLVVLDPIQAYLGASVDMYRANEVRPVMSRIAALAEEYKCAFVLIGHINKSVMMKAKHRGLGSVDFTAAARSAILCARVRDDPDVRVLAPLKSSLT
jgi:RecA-family ATPase